MRIITGEIRGRHLKTVPGLNTRPTADKVKGAIFNVLREKVSGAKVLDLFAGTGNLAIEALSRQASKAVLVEKNPVAVSVIKENLVLAEVSELARLMDMDAFTYLRLEPKEVFDLIFLDPPYRQGLISKVLAAIAEPCRLSLNGVIVAETAKDEDITGSTGPFEIRKTGEYGDTKIWYLQRAD